MLTTTVLLLLTLATPFPSEVSATPEHRGDSHEREQAEESTDAARFRRGVSLALGPSGGSCAQPACAYSNAMFGMGLELRHRISWFGLEFEGNGMRRSVSQPDDFGARSGRTRMRRGTLGIAAMPKLDGIVDPYLGAGIGAWQAMWSLQSNEPRTYTAMLRGPLLRFSTGLDFVFGSHVGLSWRVDYTRPVAGQFCDFAVGERPTECGLVPDAWTEGADEGAATRMAERTQLRPWTTRLMLRVRLGR